MISGFRAPRAEQEECSPTTTVVLEVQYPEWRARSPSSRPGIHSPRLLYGILVHNAT